MSSHSVLETWTASWHMGEATPAMGHCATCQPNKEETWEVLRPQNKKIITSLQNWVSTATQFISRLFQNPAKRNMNML